MAWFSILLAIVIAGLAVNRLRPLSPKINEYEYSRLIYTRIGVPYVSNQEIPILATCLD
jgi:hypothetical protein